MIFEVQSFEDLRLVAPHVPIYDITRIINPFSYKGKFRQTNVLELIKFLGIRAFTSQGDFMCKTNLQNKKITITNKESFFVRQKFLVAHALGHMIFEPQNECICEDINSKNPFKYKMEEKINKFAIELLVPCAMLETVVGSKRRSTLELAEMFRVSKPAMEFAIMRLFG